MGLIDKTNHHVFQPLLYQVATGVLSPEHIAAPLRQVLRKQANTTVLKETVIGVDPAKKQCIVAGAMAGEPVSLPYDYLVLATGVQHSYFGHDEYAPFAPGLKTIADAVHLRNKILGAFEDCERTLDPKAHPELLTFVIVGAGPTGVELAGAIAELAHLTLASEFRRFDPTSLRILLVEAAPRILGSFHESLATAAKAKLEKLGVEVRTGNPVEKVDGDGVMLKGERIRCKNVFWAAGVTPSPAAKWLGAEADKAGRVKVLPDCSVPGHPDIFVVGDTACFEVNGTAAARCCPARDPAGALRWACDRQAPPGGGGSAAVQILRQGQHGDHQSRLRGVGVVRDAHVRVSRQAGMGRRPSPVPRLGEPTFRDGDAMVEGEPDSPAARPADHRMNRTDTTNFAYSEQGAEMKTWPRHPVIYEVNTWAWLNDLSRKHQRRVDLATVPEPEWDAIADQGFDAVWFMGVWERSPAGIGVSMRNDGLLKDFRRALPDFAPEDNVGSPYCVRRYVVDEQFGGRSGLAIARRLLDQRGLRLILDFVPNHVAPDHPWVSDHPEYFIQGSAEDARNDPESFIEFGGKVFACGRDPYFPAWPDVLQLNAFQPGAPAGGDRDDLGDRRTVRRHPVRHGHAPAERHLRAYLGGPRRSQARRRLLEDGDPGDQGTASGVQVHRRGVLGPGVGTAAAGFRLLLRQETL